jgi:hypothetical protein
MFIRDDIPWNCDAGRQPPKFMGHGVLLTLNRHCLQAAIPTQGAVSFLPLDRTYGRRHDRLAGRPFVERRVKASARTWLRRRRPKRLCGLQESNLWGTEGSHGRVVLHVGSGGNKGNADLIHERLSQASQGCETSLYASVAR